MCSVQQPWVSSRECWIICAGQRRNQKPREVKRLLQECTAFQMHCTLDPQEPDCEPCAVFKAPTFPWGKEITSTSDADSESTRQRMGHTWSEWSPQHLDWG